MKRLLFGVAVLFFGTAAAKEYTVSSPDGAIVVTVDVDRNVTWSVSRGAERLMTGNRIALEFEDDGEFVPMVRNIERRSVDETGEAQMPTKFRTLKDRYNELLIALRGDRAVRFRVYDNGAAYRFETSRRGAAVIESETAQFNFAADNDVWWANEKNPDFISHNEAFFERKKLSAIERSVYAFLPVLVATPAGTRMVVTETWVEDYPCMFLFGGSGTRLDGRFPPVVLQARLREGSDRNEEFIETADYIARTDGERTFPWRIVTIDADDRALLENYLAYQLAPEAVKGDASWVKPGKISWEWWHALTNYGVDFEAGVNTRTYKYYIDFAAKFGLEYILLDEGWSASTLNVKEPGAAVDVRELVRYGREKGVGVILWTIWGPMKKDIRGVLDTYKKWGVKGIKIDFMQRSDQEMVNFYEQIARECFDRKLLVDFHGSFAPRGLQRKYPNVMSFEGVYGMENDKSSVDISPAHDCTLPFTRMVAGPMDYTPGATQNSIFGEFQMNWNRPMSQGTRAHQAALYVVFESPLQMLCDSPSHYLRTPEFTEFIAAVPTVWDDTRALSASVGEYVAVARRSGEEWFVGAITDWSGREMSFDLGFLGEGRWRMTVLEDGVNAGSYAADFRVVSSEVGAGQIVTARLASGGGWAARFEKVSAE